jgi:XTP/dITP diphosphohydrolase
LNSVFIIASTNPGKIDEIRSILSFDDVAFRDLEEVGFNEPIDEYGKTFEENALIKASVVFGRYGLPTLADDSGLVVTCLRGEPGVRSARYAGPDADDERNNRLLLERLKNTECDDRRARFLCTAVFYYGSGLYCTAEGRVMGTISARPAGTGGFGYDPLFYVPGLGRTMAQLTDEQKNRISHRGEAFRKLRPCIEEYLARKRRVE